MRIKDIPGFEGYYAVTDLGFVIAAYRRFHDKNGMMTSRPSKVLVSYNTKVGYRQVALCKMNEITIATVHRLVAQAFVEPYRGEHVNHIDGDKKNNHYTNLEWCTPQGNTLHYHLRKRRIELTATEIDEIIGLHGVMPPKEIAQQYNVHINVVSHLVCSKERSKRTRPRR